MAKAQLEKKLDALKAEVKGVSMTDLVKDHRPPAKEPEVIPDVTEVVDNVKDRLKLRNLVAEDYQWGRKESEAKKAREVIKPQIRALASKYGISKLGVNEYRINYFNAPRYGLAQDIPNTKLKLFSMGLTNEQVESLFGYTDQYTLRITQPGQKVEDE